MITASKSLVTGAGTLGFDAAAGSWLERVLFSRRNWVLALCLLITFLMLGQLPQLRPNASFERTVPTEHPYIANYLTHRSDLPSGNFVRIAVAAREGDIYSAEYVETLRKINDEAFLLPGVDRTKMKSLWTPSTRWLGVTEEGLEGGPVIPNAYNGSAASLAQLRENIERSNEVGFTVAKDHRSTIVQLPLLAKMPDGSKLDYRQLNQRLDDLRQRYESDRIGIHMTGFAKVIGDLIAGMGKVLGFFVISILLSAVALYAYTRCLRSTGLVIACSLVAVIWQLGLLPSLGFGLDTYSMLVPFLTFAIGISHGAQKMNGIMQDIGRGADRLTAARLTFRRLFMAGFMALVCDAVGFAVLLTIEIQVIRDLALIACLGVAVLIVTNLILLPVLLSYVGVSPSAAHRSVANETALTASTDKLSLSWLAQLTTRRWALPVVLSCVVLAVVGYAISMRLQVGDLEPGAPELRQSSRYNQDNAFMTNNFGASSDVLVAMVKTPSQGCSAYDTLAKVDALDWELRQSEGVETTASLATLIRRVTVGLNEGNALWSDLLRNQAALNSVTGQAPRGLYNEDCSLLPMYIFLKDHKAETLTRATAVVTTFAANNDTADVKFLLGAGNAGFDAATNEVVAQNSQRMLLLVYGAVALLCLFAFRSWRATLCALVPLALTSILAEALMVILGIGVKVATLPVIALGVGIGVDYALYIMSIVLASMRSGATLADAYATSLRFTGRVVLFTGATLAIGVATWVFSPIKFQADMGLLLAFMFLLNMVGSLTLLPALAHFLLRTQDVDSNATKAAAPVET
jgi:uncharacterized protein